MTGYKSKKAAALDEEGMYLVHHTEGRVFDKLGNKVHDDDDTQVYKDHDDALTIAYQSGFHDGKKAAQRTWVGSGDLEDSNAYQTPPAQPEQERNFCPRCGKRTQDIHTCTPPHA